MVTIVRESRPTARKPHRCMLCCGPIAPGEVYTRDVMRYDGFYEWIECAACEVDGIGIEVHIWADRDDGYNAEDAQEWAHEMRADEKVGEAARRWLNRNGCTCETCQPEGES